MDNRFDIICRHKDANPSNVNEIFESYGCSTLEAKVPIVNDKVAEKVKNSNYEHQKYDKLALKSESGMNAAMGRVARTRDRPLSLVEIGQDIVIAAGKPRERSPIYTDELNDELDEYMKKTAEIKAQRAQAKQTRQEQARERALALPDLNVIKHNIDPDWD